MRLKAEKACNFNAIVWVLGEVNGYVRIGRGFDAATLDRLLTVIERRS